KGVGEARPSKTTTEKRKIIERLKPNHAYHSIAELQAEIEEYLVCYNQKRIKLGLKGLSPVLYRAQNQ
ncbi:IS3 family transposase, partial [uncultured Haemophilus sp.]|uniref:IS3 family transposase n=1 Tax=uncultured Haemophilus sp. TaxID=237779 RepID=UPI00258DB536